MEDTNKMRSTWSIEEMMPTIAKNIAIEMAFGLAYQMGERREYFPYSSPDAYEVKASWCMSYGCITVSVSVRHENPFRVASVEVRPFCNTYNERLFASEQSHIINDALAGVFPYIKWASKYCPCDVEGCTWIGRGRSEDRGVVDLLPLCDFIDGQWRCEDCQEKIERLAKEQQKIADAERRRELQEKLPERQKLTPKIRFQVLDRDGYTCQSCGRKAPDVVLHVDHVMPIAKGGKTEMGNLRVLCRDCNLGKSARLPLSISSVQDSTV